MRVGLFPGQGLDPAAVASALDPRDRILHKANEILGYDIRRKVEQVTKRSRPVLSTSVAQPAIFVAGLIAFKKAVKRAGRFDYLVGHSLGEYTALVSAGAIPFTQGLKLVAVRGQAMQAAGAATPGGMAAVMNLSLDDAEYVCRKTGVTVANDNSPEQVVLSGREQSLSKAAQMVRAMGGRSVLLPVDGPYHSAAMKLAVDHLSGTLTQTYVRSPRETPVISNVSAAPYRAPGEIRKLLTLQLTNRVRFRESISYLLERGDPEFVDLGPGRVVGRLAEVTARHGRRSVARA
jgi:malonyl CoA-acyl carrier protein transacylase